MSQSVLYTCSLRGVAADGTAMATGGTLESGGTVFFGQAPQDAYGGGVTIGTATLVNSITTVFGTVRLLDANSSGVVTGTIGYASGAATANTPVAFTIATPYFLDGGHYIAAKWGTVSAAGLGYNLISVGGVLGR
jgi:hypothetical protein